MNSLVKLGLGALALVLYTLGSGFGGWMYAHYRAEKERAAQVVEATKNTEHLATENAVAVAPVIKEVERIKVVTQTVIQKVPEVQIVHVPAPTQDCPAAITYADGVLLDAAARGADPPAGPGADGPPVPAADVTRTVAANYGTCRVDQERLVGLQDYVRRNIIEQTILCPGK